MRSVKIIAALLLTVAAAAGAYGQRTVWVLSGVYTERSGGLELRKHGDTHNTLVSFSKDSAFVLSIQRGEYAFPYYINKDVLYFGTENEWKPVGRFATDEVLMFFDRDRDINQYRKAKPIARQFTNAQIREALHGKTYSIAYPDLFQEPASPDNSDKLTFGPKDQGTHANGDTFYVGIESFGNAHYLFVDYRGGYFFQIRDISDEAIVLVSTYKNEHDVVLPRVWAK